MPAEISKVKELFLAVLEMPAVERAAYLDTACAGDTALRQQIEAMLQSHENSGELLARSPAELLHGDATDADATGAFTPPADPSATQFNPTQHESDELSFLAPSAKPGQLGRLGPYEVQKRLGKGGFGVVLKAFDERLHRVVAIKVLSPAYAAIGTARKRFIREAQAAAAVKNEHVVGIHDVDANANPPYLVMEYIEGVSLQDKIDKDGTIGVKELLRIGMQMAEGLAAAHKQGLVHRDIKPANILLENGVERVKITDFGLARAVDDASVTQSGTVAGTPMYMSPEQAEGLPIDHRSDLFSLGTVLYAMCTGHPPFRASGTHAVLKRVIDASPRPIRELNNEIPDWLCAMIGKLHAKKAEERFQTAKEVAELLGQRLADVQAGRAIQSEPSRVTDRVESPEADAAAGPVGRHTSPRRWRRLRWVAAAAFVCVGVFLLAELTGVSRVFYAPSYPVALTSDDPGTRVRIWSMAQDDPTMNLEGDLKILGTPAYVLENLTTAELDLPAGNYLLVADLDGQEGDRQFIKVRHNYFSTAHRLPNADWRAGSFVGTGLGDRINGNAHRTVTVTAAANLAKLKEQKRQATPASEEPGWVQLFNGKDLNGWKVQGIDKGQWKWEQNALAVNAVDNGTALLQSLKEYRNFEMRFQARILDTHVILRLRWADRGRGSTNVTLGGAENSPERWGRISPFDETMDKANRSGMDAALKTIKGGDFNDVLVKFVGRRITVKINGVTTYEGDTACDHDAGIIDWSTSGPGRAWIRNAEIKELAPEVPGAAPVELCKFEGEKTTPWTVVLSQDGSRALSGHRESGPVILWDVAAGPIVKRMANGHPGVQAVAFGPDESWAVSGGTDKIVRIWDLKTGEQLRQSEKLGVNISKLVLFRDGKRALVGATDGRGALIDATQVPLRWLGLDPFIPTFFDTDTNKVGSLAVALSPDESLALSGGGTKVGKIGLWNVKSGKFVRLFKSPHAKQIRWLAFAPDGTRAVSASADGTCRIWDVASGEEKLAFTKHGQQVQHAVFFPDGRHVVSTGWDNFARIWDSQTGNEVHVIALPSKGCSLALSADGRLLLIGCSDSGPAAEKVDFGIRAWQLPPMPIDETGWTPLFNGKDLAGWDLSGDDPAAWSVKDGQLVAKSKSSMLRTKRANFVNFRLRAEAKIDGKGTAWLWFRTKEIGKRPGHAVVLNGAEVRPLLNGYLMGVPDFGDSMTAGIGAKAVPPDDWFTLELIADGHKLLAKINGVTTGESSDISMQNGVICLQIGEGTQIVFRKIEIQELPHGPPVSDRAKLQGEWIGKKNEVKGKVFPGVANFSFTFTGDRARLKITAEAEPSKIIQDLEGVLLLDPSANPKRIRVIAPDTAKNVKQFIGIYDWQGDDLRICYQLYEAAPAEPEYPTAFASDPKSPYKILVLRRAAAGPIEPAWVPLFNGKDLKNWTLPATGCEVKDGELILKTVNATATIATDGGAPRFHLRAEAKISPNGGGFFEFWPKDKKSQLVFLGASNGHIRGAPFKKTPYPADWFLLEVLATEDRITVKVDGVTTSEYQLTDADRKNREGEGSRCLRFSAGGLTELRFRKIEIKELPPE